MSAYRHRRDRSNAKIFVYLCVTSLVWRNSARKNSPGDVIFRALYGKLWFKSGLGKVQVVVDAKD